MALRNRILVLAIALTLVMPALGACAASEATYPKRPVTMIIPFPPGGGMDTLGRPLVEAAKPFFPQPITIVNRGGASGTVGTAEAIAAANDGYTIGFTTTTATALQPHRTQLPYKSPDEYRVVMNVIDLPMTFCVSANSPWKTMKDLVDYAKANPGKVRAATSGIGGIPHASMELLQEAAGIDLTIVPFDGDGPAATQLLGGHVEVHLSAPTSHIAHIKAGTLRPLAVMNNTRLPGLPDVPTFMELGYDVNLLPRYFVFVPKGTPENIVETLHQAFKKAMETDAFKKFAEDNLYSLHYMGPGEMTKVLQDEYNFFGTLVKKFNWQ